jgi:hypothetical protein
MWIFYNQKRYGELARRKYPGPTTKEDLMGLDMSDETTYEKLQCQKVIILETNPIRNGEDSHEIIYERSIKSC